MAFQQTLAMSSPMEGQPPSPGGGFGAPAPGSPPPGGGFGAPPAQPQPGFGGPTAAPVAPKKKRSPLIYVAIGCVALLALSCIGGNLWWFLFAPDGDDVAAAIEDAVEEGGGSALCSRAVECCEAYVTEMTAAGTPGLDATSTCAVLRMAGVTDPACQSTIDGYRAGLQAMSRTVPTSCQ